MAHPLYAGCLNHQRPLKVWHINPQFSRRARFPAIGLSIRHPPDDKSSMMPVPSSDGEAANVVRNCTRILGVARRSVVFISITDRPSTFPSTTRWPNVLPWICASCSVAYQASSFWRADMSGIFHGNEDAQPPFLFLFQILRGRLNVLSLILDRFVHRCHSSPSTRYFRFLHSPAVPFL